MYSKFTEFSFEGKACHIQFFMHTCTDAIVNKHFCVTYNRSQQCIRVKAFHEAVASGYKMSC